VASWGISSLSRETIKLFELREAQLSVLLRTAGLHSAKTARGLEKNVSIEAFRVGRKRERALEKRLSDKSITRKGNNIGQDPCLRVVGGET